MTLSRIQAKAAKRQEAWAAGDRPNETHRLTVDLNGRDYVMRPEGLYAEGRQETAGQMEPGNPTTNRMYRA